MQGKLIFLLLQSLPRHPMVHPHDVISEHAFGMGDREEVAVLTVHPYDPNPYMLQWEELEKAHIYALGRFIKDKIM